jgi:hypothetical protein
MFIAQPFATRASPDGRKEVRVTTFQRPPLSRLCGDPHVVFLQPPEISLALFRKRVRFQKVFDRSALGVEQRADSGAELVFGATLLENGSPPSRPVGPEISQEPLETTAQVDFLFGRLFAFIHLVLTANGRTG